ncbi:Tkp3 protein [Vanderwaltozyma polyspora DSM 70294]|uniref:Tkp3 protein n=1 Tax=Vanderwaltozyma polyspora (strain ATCC 22028 / DSM 70294 / BCRC 21397 / CBS 2163 / NBRC 10782 / NRRL Y-8283 / UCD 57-17) TaxID=436907 RepID=A7TPY6_VANPO|nr:Tkp3 protein [Vanderwaltozyma polyspora DSM 70294]EDO15684.1 Tkp3 protein [Vanderwaltozyma polyspora DSM 70294]
MEQRIMRIEERLNNGNPNDINGFKSRSKLPSQNETLAKVERHFPSLVIYGNHSLVANCNKDYSEVSVSMNNDAILKDEDIEDPLNVLLTIQSLLVGKHVRFQDRGNFLYSCCKTNARSYLTDQRGFIVDWTTAIAKFFQTFDFGARTQSELSELSHFNPKAGDDAREYFVNLVHKGKAIRGASTLSIVTTKINDILMHENLTIVRPNITDIHNFMELFFHVKTNIPRGIILQGKYSKPGSAPVFAIDSSKPKSSSYPRRKSKFSTATFYCVNCSCSKCSGTIIPYMKRGFSKYKCERCSSRIRSYKKSNIADMKANVLETANHPITTDDSNTY